MLGDISQVGVRYDCDSLDPLVMSSNEAKLIDHCAKTLPSRKRRSFDDEASQTTGCLDVRVDRLREFHKVVLLGRRSWWHEQDGMLGIEFVFDHVSLLYNRCGPRAEGSSPFGHPVYSLRSPRRILAKDTLAAKPRRRLGCATLTSAITA